MVAQAQACQSSRICAMTGKHYATRLQRHIACCGNSNNTAVFDFDLTPVLVCFGRCSVIGIEQHQIIGNARTVHALQLHRSAVRQCYAAGVGNVAHNLLLVALHYITAARRSIHSDKIALILNVADNPAVGIKIRRVDGSHKTSFRRLLSQAAASVIHACSRKWSQLQACRRRNAHQIAYDWSAVQLLLRIGIGNAACKLRRCFADRNAVNIQHQTVRIFQVIQLVLAILR